MSKIDIQLCFLGGASEIGASSALLKVGDSHLLIDAGVRFQTGNALPNLEELSGISLDAILITHAHSDHTGALPVVHEAFPTTPIYMTPPTLDLVSVLQKDALLLMDKAARNEGEIPLYQKEQVESMLSKVELIHHHHSIDIGEAHITYLPASHILGASMIHIATRAGNILFTGDYCISAQKTVPALTRPSYPVDLLITESTYGNRLHSDRKTAEMKLIRKISEVVENEGRVLIPCFAIGRAQEVLLLIKQAIRQKKMPAVPVFVDGMIRPVCQVYQNHPRYITNYLAKEIKKNTHPFFTREIQPVNNHKERPEILKVRPVIIVSSSGMLAGGPSAYYAEDFVRYEQDAILITGYQDEESPGRALLDLAKAVGPKEIKLNGKSVPVKCTFGTYSLSAHADRMQMVGLIEAIKPKTVFLVHGDKEAKDEFARSLTAKDIELITNGDQCTRSYATGRKKLKNVNDPKVSLTRKQAKALFGTSVHLPLSITQLAESWFGKEVSPNIQEKFVENLVAAGYARRDDHKHSKLWSLLGEEKEFASIEEKEVYQQLKERNPKSTLLEFCMRRHLEPPEVVEEQEMEGQTLLKIQVIAEGECYSSDVQKASFRQLAEQLAYANLLEKLTKQFQREETYLLSEEEQLQLKSENPKGKLLEFCLKNKYPEPVFETKAILTGFTGMVRFSFSETQELVSRLYQAKGIKSVEQAAASDILQQLATHTISQTEPNEENQNESKALVNSTEESSSQDPRTELNYYRQLGLIQNFGYELIGTQGSSHLPLFILKAWAEFPSGERLECEEVQANTKKEAQKISAQKLLNRLVELQFQSGS